MSRYRLTGPSGTGKTTVSRESTRRGYTTIEADNVLDLSAWTNIKTQELVPHKSPFTKEWLKQHRFSWDKQRMHELLNNLTQDKVFLVGDAFNLLPFLKFFTQAFAFSISDQKMAKRLQLREPERWPNDSPELKNILKWNGEFPDKYRSYGVIFIDESLSAVKVADKIEVQIHAGQ